VGLKLLTAPAAGPVSLATAKAQARIDYVQAEQDLWLSGTVIPGCTGRVEEYLGRRLMKQQWLLTLDGFPPFPFAWPAPVQGTTLPRRIDRAILLPYAGPLFYVAALPGPPVVPANLEVKYVDAAGALQTLDPAEYQVRTSEEPAELVPAYGKAWPGTRNQKDAVEVRYWAGYATAEEVPAAIREAIAIFCATQAANREAAVTGTISTELPLSAQWLLDPYRIVRFAA